MWKWSVSSLNSYLEIIAPIIKEHHLGAIHLYHEKLLSFKVSGIKKRICFDLSNDSPSFYLDEDERFNVSSLDNSSFCMLKRILPNPFLLDVKVCENDRIVILRLEILNNVYKKECRFLIFEAIPHHPNLIVTSEDYQIIWAYRYLSLSDARPLLKGMHYSFPQALQNLSVTTFNLNEWNKELEIKRQEDALKRRKERFASVFTSLENRQKLLRRKIEALKGDLDEAQIHLNDGLYGDYIYTNYQELKEGKKVEDSLKLSLDKRLSLSENASRFYKKAKKAKKTLEVASLEIKKTEQELLETKETIALFKAANEENLESMALELGLLPRNIKVKNKPSRKLPHFELPYQVNYQGTKILFGKSAKQNDCLTFLLETSKNHLWLHALGVTGPHVIIKNDSPNKEVIRMASSLALSLAKKSVGEVIIAKRGDIYKGNSPGEAKVKVYQTLYLKELEPNTSEVIKSAKKIEI